MGKLYSRSIDEAYRKYFAKRDSLEKGKNRYNKAKDQIFLSSDAGKYQAGGIGGVPISYNKESGYVAIDDSDSHTLFFGATGSQKTRIGIMPTVVMLGKAEESMIICDPKSEIYNRTSSMLEKQGYIIKVLKLRSTSYSDGWNPFGIPYEFYQRGEVDKAYEFVNDIAHNLMISDAKNGKDPFWENSAISLLFGLTIFLFKYCKEFGLPAEYINVANILKLREEMFSGSSLKIAQSDLWNYGKTDSFIYSALVGTVETASDTRGGILSTFDEKMTCFKMQPGLLELLCNDNIRFDDVGKEKCALFIIMPDEKTIFHRLVALFVKQSYEYLVYQVHKDEYSKSSQSATLSRRVNYVLDEFSALPPISDFPAMITAARSRNIRFFLVAQSKNQLKQRYEDETETIQSNCNNWFFFTSRELPLLKEISELCGNTNNQKPVIEAASLQHLSKEDHETLILCGRNLPYITMLPDIDYYLPQGEIRPIFCRIKAEIKRTDFEKCYHAKKIDENVIMKHPINPFETTDEFN